jgi:hypothetical protein
MIFLKYLEDYKKIYMTTLKDLNNNKVMIYIIFFIIYFFIYYSIIIPQISKDSENNILFYISEYLVKSKISIIIIIVVDVIILISLIGGLVQFNKRKNTLTDKIKLAFLLPSIFSFSILIFLNILTFNKYLLIISNSPITKYVFVIFSNLFYIIYLSLFLYNFNNEINIEFFIAFEILILFTIENILFSISNIYKVYYQLDNDDFTTLSINCTSNNIEKYSDNEEKSKNNIQIIEISKNYGDTYLKTEGNSPVAFYNKNINNYQDLILADFYYPGSYYSYLSDSPLNGSPNLEALKIVLSTYKSRVIHLDLFSDKKDIYDPNAKAVVRCENMKDGKKALDFDEVLGVINKWAWINSDPSNLSYPLFLYLNLNFNQDNESIYIKIYDSLLKVFSKYLVDKKYSFSGRNSTFPISMAKMKECIGKIIIITSVYPTKTVLDELINSSTNNLNNSFNMNLYKESYITFDKIGISEDNDKTVLLNNSKTTINFYYALPNKKDGNNNQDKQGLYNPSFQDCAQYGIQGTLMYLFIPDDNFNKWNLFFKNKNNLNPVLKDESLRYVIKTVAEIAPQNPVVGLQKPQKYCLIPGMMSTEKSNISGDVANSSC